VKTRREGRRVLLTVYIRMATQVREKTTQKMRHGNEKIGGRAVFPTFAMLRMNSLLGEHCVPNFRNREGTGPLGPGEQFTPDHDGVLKQIFCISDSGVDTGSVTYTASCHCLLHLHLAGARSCRTRPSAPKGDE